MRKLIPLLKYLDRSKITAEAVTEIAALLGRKIEGAQAAELATAYKTRGVPGLMEHVPFLLASERTSDANLEDSQYVTCPTCGQLLEIKNECLES